MPNQPVTLTNEALAEISSRPSVKTAQWCLHRVLITESERDALCQTVRALQEREKQYARVLSDRLREMNSLGELVSCQDEDGDSRECGVCNTCLTTVNAALREQLAQVQAENQRLASQLKEWQEEKDTKAGYL